MYLYVWQHIFTTKDQAVGYMLEEPLTLHTRAE